MNYYEKKKNKVEKISFMLVPRKSPNFYIEENLCRRNAKMIQSDRKTLCFIEILHNICK